jgi:hypothetical protein
MVWEIGIEAGNILINTSQTIHYEGMDTKQLAQKKIDATSKQSIREKSMPAIAKSRMDPQNHSARGIDPSGQI